MAGTRRVIARYLDILEIDADTIGRIIDIMVRRPGYPAFASICNFLKECGIECKYGRVESLLFIEDIYLGRLLSDDFTVVLILQANSKRVIYFDCEGKIKRDTFDHFCSIFKCEVMSIWIEDKKLIQEKVRLQWQQEQNTVQIDGSIANLRRESKLNEPPIYRICRNISIYFSYVFVKLKIHPNYITFSWLACVGLAAYLFSRNDMWYNRFGGALLILLGYIFDCSDGEVARVTKKYSKIGGYLDTITHWISGLIIILGVTLGIYNRTGEPGVFRIGLIAILGSSIFNYLYGQLNSWRNQNSTYGLFHPIFLPLAWLFPIDLNFFLIGAIINELQGALRIWGIASLILSAMMSGLFFAQEYAYAKGYK